MGPRCVLICGMNVSLLLAVIWLAAIAAAQTTSPSTSAESSPPHAKARTSAKHDMGSGAGDIGKGALKGAGSAAKGTGKAAADLVTLHPINSAADLGKGA